MVVSFTRLQPQAESSDRFSASVSNSPIGTYARGVLLAPVLSDVIPPGPSSIRPLSSRVLQLPDVTTGLLGRALSVWGGLHARHREGRPPVR